MNLTTTNPEEVRALCEKFGITPKIQFVVTRPKTKEDYLESKRVASRKYRARLRAGMPERKHCVPVLRSQFQPGKLGARLYHKEYRRAWYHLRQKNQLSKISPYTAI